MKKNKSKTLSKKVESNSDEDEEKNQSENEISDTCMQILIFYKIHLKNYIIK